LNTLLKRVMPADEHGKEMFALLDLPTVPLLHILGFLPHPSLLPIAASCKSLHATVHSSSKLWRQLTLLPSMLMSSTTTQSFIGVLGKHGSRVRAVKVKYTEEKGMLENMQQLLAFLAAFCPSLVHISLPYLTTYNFPPTNQLRLLANSFPNLRSLTIKMYEGSKGIEQLAKLSSLEHLHLVFSNDRKSQEKLSNVFASIKRLRKVTIGAVSFDPSRPGPATAIFVKALVNSNPDLEEICTDTWEGGVKVSKKDKSTLKKKSIKHHEEDTIPDSDIESEEDGEIEDEEDSDDDSDSSEDHSEDGDSSEEMRNSEESSGEDEIGGGIGDGEDGIEGSVDGASVSGEERSSVCWRIPSFFLSDLSFILLTSIICLFGNYFFGIPSYS